MSMYDDPRMRTETPHTDTERWRCSWNEGGERCHFPGAISSETKGGGRYFCRFHFFSCDPAKAADFVVLSRTYQPGTLPVVTRELVDRYPEYTPREWLILEGEEEAVNGG